MSKSDTVFVGIDVGGTFTDLVLFDRETALIRSVKVPSTPPNYYPSVIDSLREAGLDPKSAAMILHGTTVHLNAFLEGKGAKTALVATKGFGDIYEMRRGNRPTPYDMHFQYPAPLVPRKRVFEIDERTLATGEVMKSPDEAGLEALAEAIAGADVEAVAICLLHSYRNPANEQRIADYLRARLPDVFVSPSSDTCKEWREFERTSTAVINAYVCPILKWYLSQLEGALEEWRQTRLFLLQSNGGLISATEAASKGVLTLLSGPVGGNVACRALSQLGRARSLDLENLICIDMGGTSFEASLVVNGESAVRHEREIGGFPILAPMVDIHTIGAGGGSIAWSDAGALRIGPHSAGANPGPASYGKGGTDATVTDANMALGRLPDKMRFGAGLHLDHALAKSAVSNFAEQFSLGLTEAAQGILDVVNEQMANAIRTITVRRGIDPRTFKLVAYGGAGPMHAADIARLLEVKTVVVPRSAGTFSAWGMLQSDIVHEVGETLLAPFAKADWAEIDRRFSSIESDFRDVLVKEGVKEKAIAFERTLDIRYEGQEYSVALPLTVDIAKTPREEILKTAHAAFNALYKATFGHSNEEENLEISGIRLKAIGRSEFDTQEFIAAEQKKPEDIVETTTRKVFFNNAFMDTKFVGRAYVAEHGETPGPLIVIETTATTIVPPDFKASIDALGNLILTQMEATNV